MVAVYLQSLGPSQAFSDSVYEFSLLCRSHTSHALWKLIESCFGRGLLHRRGFKQLQCEFVILFFSLCFIVSP